MTITLDSTDRRIIACLQEDGRMSASDISRRLDGVPERTVRYRIERLSDRAVMHVGAIVDPKAIGYGVTADIWIEVVPDRLREVAGRLAEFEEVSYVAYSTGERDLSIQVYARDNESLHTFVSDVVGHIPGVTRTSTMLVPWKVKDVHQWRVPDKAPSNRSITG
ncbi:MAG: Lrp/AsnC family transcriptional regulator [Actinobacteria bacterium]|nr:Lrp/AsnC family transcriptional regulator [Actinomycetota bacterium]